MQVNRTIAGLPARTTDETISKIFELANAWGGERMEINLEESRTILRPLIIDRTLEMKEVRVKYDTHELFINCIYENEAIEYDLDNETLPETLPSPRGEVEWTLRITPPDSLLTWCKSKIAELGISDWLKIEGHIRSSSQVQTSKPTNPQTFNEEQLRKSLGLE
jgi:hypothetical protein